MKTIKLASSIATGALLFGVMAPVAAFAHSTHISVHGNGAGSYTSISTTSSNTTDVSQSSETTTINEVNSFVGTGGNKANKNTDGNTMVKTGDATNTVSIYNVSGFNIYWH